MVTEPARGRKESGRWSVRLVIAAVALVCYALDQGTKQLALSRLDPADPPSYLGGFVKFRLLFNPGAAFSFGSSATIAFTVLALAALVFCLVHVVPRVRSLGWAAVAGLAIAGIAGNLTDRIFRAPSPFRGHVVDFIALPNFAVFNVADICITLTAVFVVLGTLVDWRRQDRLVKEPAADALPGDRDEAAPGVDADRAAAGSETGGTGAGEGAER